MKNSMHITHLLIIFFGLLTLGIGACRSGGTENQQSDAGTPGYTQARFIDPEGSQVTLESLKGKVVFINFWATWCPPCIEEMPSIEKLKNHFEGNPDIVFLLVDVDNNRKKSEAFMQELQLDLPVYTPDSPIPSEFLGAAIPTTVVLDKKGAIAARMEGGRDYADREMIQAFEEMLRAKP